MTSIIRDLTIADFPRVLQMNNAAVPAVNRLDADDLAELVRTAYAAIAVVEDADSDTVLGFVLAFTAGADYASENYRWFSERSRDFLYVDRIVVGEGARSQGLGPVLYQHLFTLAQAQQLTEITCEVNVEPPNPGSLAFHTRLGFERVGTQATKGDSVVVALLAAPVAL